ncbi:hypothetical protein EDB81DRAFT_914000 [Dactylonectria macrodidyma]|uniref:BZIP domain-containing protein n=1 Tax=Dactylonectria macrodidyma TaxID=307937 RepID=A0A9P9IJG6_9HYPO|nr:hypothetical protein EDB81DRAFT_914000 [Dactylonectria macrodidyma]
MARPSSAEPAKASKRKGTRNMSTLTPSQRVRKRANDREAQRVNRARSKETIERLEGELEELKAIQELIRRNKALEDEISMLRDAMGFLAGRRYNRYVFDDSVNAFSGTMSSPQSSQFPGCSATIQDFDQLYLPLPDACGPWGSNIACSVPSTGSSPSSSRNIDEYGDEYGDAYISIKATTSMVEWDPSSTMACFRGQDVEREFEDMRTGKDIRVRPLRYGISPSQFQTLRGSRPAACPLIRQPSSSFWEVPVLITAPATEVDRLLVTFIHDCRRMTRAESLGGILSPSKANIKPLLEYHPASPIHNPPELQIAGRHMRLAPAVSGPAANHPVTELATALCNNVGMTSIIERLAVFAPLRRMVSWLVHPTTQTYAELRDDFKPTRIQRTIPHSQWIDFLHCKRLRDVVIQRPDVYDTEEMQIIYSRNLRLVNWASRQVDALIFDAQSGDVWLSDTFLAYAEDPKNWKLSRDFLRRYPELGGFVEMDQDW